jgi:hypothetical protein
MQNENETLKIILERGFKYVSIMAKIIKEGMKRWLDSVN